MISWSFNGTEGVSYIVMIEREVWKFKASRVAHANLILVAELATLPPTNFPSTLARIIVSLYRSLRTKWRQKRFKEVDNKKNKFKKIEEIRTVV